VSAYFIKIKKEQYRSVIRFLFLEGKSRSEIKERLDAEYGASSPSMATVKNWLNEFQRGRTSVFDEPRPGASKIATTEDNVIKINDFVLADRQSKVSEIAETVGISKTAWVTSSMKFQA
jgi:transposase